MKSGEKARFGIRDPLHVRPLLALHSYLKGESKSADEIQILMIIEDKRNTDYLLIIKTPLKWDMPKPEFLEKQITWTTFYLPTLQHVSLSFPVVLIVMKHFVISFVTCQVYGLIFSLLLKESVLTFLQESCQGFSWISFSEHLTHCSSFPLTITS